MSLDDTQTKVAMDLFNQGKLADFDLDGVIAQFKSECHRRRTLMQMFLEILLHAAYADGVLHPREDALLRSISTTLGFAAAVNGTSRMARENVKRRGFGVVILTFTADRSGSRPAATSAAVATRREVD